MFCKLCTFTVFTAYVVLISMMILALQDPYAILRIKRNASPKEIKDAYKSLARTWHPDKNSDPEAQDKFVEINKAYEILSDPDRKKDYDMHGITEDTPNFRQKPDYSQFRRFDPMFEAFQSGPSFEFHYSDNSHYHKHTVTTRAYENNLVPSSAQQPYLIMFYGDWCISCIQAEPIWRKIVGEFEKIGFGIATVHAELESGLTKKIGVSTLPHVIMLLDGHPYHYKERQLSLAKVIDFAKWRFPYKTVQYLTSLDDVTDFLNGWIFDNRVRVLFFSKHEQVKLRYLVAAFKYKQFADAGFVSLSTEQGQRIANKYGIKGTSTESLLIFNENPQSPVVSLSMADISFNTIEDVMSANKFLALPRLSSQALFDLLCPPEAMRSRKRLCVILLTSSAQDEERFRSSMRSYVHEFPVTSDRVKFVYVYRDKQEGFVSSLSNGIIDVEGKDATPVVILWRVNANAVQYEYVTDGWDMDRLNASQENIRVNVQKLLRSTDPLTHNALVKSLTDEHAKTIFTRMITKLVTAGEYLRDNISRDEAIPAISVIGTVLFIVFGGYIMSYLMKLEEASIREKYRREGVEVPDGVRRRSEVGLKVHELRGETYNGLVRLLKPGCRTILLLVDNESKPKLLPQFNRIVYPYRKNKTLLFGYLMLEKHVDWFRCVLMQALSQPRDLQVNPKNCIGTVVSLNGFRKYFCMYHAKHVENYSNNTRHGGDFLGFSDDSDSESSDLESGSKPQKPEPTGQKVLLHEHLLDDLPNWLDRLFEGSTHRYYISFWPGMK